MKPINFFTIKIILIGYILNDVFLIQLGPIFVYTFRFSLILALLIILFKSTFKLNKLRNLSIYLFYFILCLSAYHGKPLLISKFWISLLFIVIIVIPNTKIKINFYDFIESNSKYFKILWNLIIIVTVLQLLKILPEQGIGIQRSSKLFFTFYERFDFSEFLVLITHIVLRKKNQNYVLPLTFLLIIITGSFSGLILSSTLFFRLNLKIKNLLKLIIVGVLVFVGFQSSKSFIFSKIESINRESRIEGNFGENLLETNWRLLSSAIIITEFINNPTLIGRGINNNAALVKPYYWNSEPDVLATSHTFIAILWDQGIIGFLAFIFVMFKLFKIFRSSVRKNRNDWILFFLSFSIMIRFLLYHQSQITFSLILLLIILNDEKHINNNVRISS